MKVVINKRHGGFSLSMRATARLAELQGRKAYFFQHDLATDTYTPTPVTDQRGGGTFWVAFDIEDPSILKYEKPWRTMTTEERIAFNQLYSRHVIENQPNDRSDSLLIQVVEEFGDKADGACASLEIVEIPDGVEYEIQEFVGLEWVAEKHRTWG
jgi:hypothetical protein